MRRSPVREAQVLRWASELAEALQHLHRRRVVHRDLKPSNLMIDRASGSLKMIDFGFACDIRPGEILRSQVGTPYYIAPEVINEYYTESCDIWSCGVIFYVWTAAARRFIQ